MQKNIDTLKISYSCTANFKQIIQAHNKKVLNKLKNNAPKTINKCNCLPTRKMNCPLNGNCCQHNVVYKATVTRADTSQVETYTGSTAQTIKDRWRGHDYDIRHPERDGTCLSKYIHKLKGQGIGYTLKWEILKKAPPWNPITNICRLYTGFATRRDHVTRKS